MRTALFHAASICALAFGLTACEGPDTSKPAVTDFGVEVPAAAVSDAIQNTYRDSDPTQTKLGAYVHFETNDDIAQGTMTVVVKDTTQTVTNRTEDTGTVTLDLVENEVSYHQSDNTSQSVVRAFQLAFKKESSTAIGDLILTPAASVLRALSVPSIGQAMGAVTTADSSDPTATPAPVTFHRLTAWEDSGPVPAGVQQRASCLGIPQCQLRERHVNYDMITYQQEAKGSRIHVELTMSPDIPQTIGYNMTPVLQYIPGLLKSCVTQLVTTSDGHSTSQVLITECQQVDDFLFQTATP